LFILSPCTDIPSSPSLTLSMALSRSAMNTVGDIGSPCLVPLVLEIHRQCTKTNDVASYNFENRSLQE